MSKSNKRHLAWVTLSITGFVLFALVFGFMALDFGIHYYPQYNPAIVESTGEIFYGYIGYSFYDLINLTLTGLLVLPFIITFCLLLLSSVAQFALSFSSNNKYDKPRHIFRRMVIVTASILLLLVLAIAITTPIFVSNFNANEDYISQYLGGGYWAMTFSLIALCVVQIVVAFMLRLKGGENEQSN